MATDYSERIFKADVFFPLIPNNDFFTSGEDGKLRGLSFTEATGTVNAKYFGAKGDLVIEKLTYETVGVVSGTDDSDAIQAALDYAGSFVSDDVTEEFEGNILCYVPYGKYYITKTLIVPPNVVLQADGILYNFLSDRYAPIVKGSRHSHCRKLVVHANAGSGVEWGDAASGSAPCSSVIDELKVWHAGVNYDAQKTPNQQKCGLRLHGLDFFLGKIWIKGGNIGLHISVASDVLASSLFLIGCACGMVIESAEQIELPSCRWDTNINQALQLDNSNNCRISGAAFVNSDSYGSAMSLGVSIGKYSGNINTNIKVDYTAQSTGGYGLEISNAKDCAIRLQLTNSRNYAQTSGNGSATSHWVPTESGALLAHNIGTLYSLQGNNQIESAAAAIKYGSNLSGFIDIELAKSSDIIATEGTPYIG
ncbi:hypothetical protein FD723_39705 (plasmid) [Nostoc sp. C052]|uniref:hypothetical protein n=1 Tax=Nostoc sp. C052 TaxID=2576902 RepID=UPI0015C322BD|nr:hypothetical protein [Nostoc sp. C052]QLE46338.1 hypothetical protein FD723_39705 [Nostoc sp. C052]